MGKLPAYLQHWNPEKITLFHKNSFRFVLEQANEKKKFKNKFKQNSKIIKITYNFGEFDLYNCGFQYVF